MKKVYKVFVTTPDSHTDILIKAMSDAGAGVVGSYTHCAFITKGFGNYMPGDKSQPFKGEANKMSREAEDKIEMICDMKFIDNVINAIIKFHPYESPTIDVFTIDFYTKS